MEAYKPAVLAGIALEEPCKRCNTDGYVYNQAWADWSNSGRNAGAPEPQELEELPCPDCEGMGSVPTESGAALLAFLNRRRVD